MCLAPSAQEVHALVGIYQLLLLYFLLLDLVQNYACEWPLAASNRAGVSPYGVCLCLFVFACLFVRVRVCVCDTWHHLKLTVFPAIALHAHGAGVQYRPVLLQHATSTSSGCDN